jgi:hypothetical protein
MRFHAVMYSTAMVATLMFPPFSLHACHWSRLLSSSCVWFIFRIPSLISSTGMDHIHPNRHNLRDISSTGRHRCLGIISRSLSMLFEYDQVSCFRNADLAPRHHSLCPGTAFRWPSSCILFMRPGVTMSCRKRSCCSNSSARRVGPGWLPGISKHVPARR